ncbi:hypothetical protein [Mycolicibacterium llatzerense]|uniref:hypothetical protein n=1 Tax=Mycolicibacterium llatzerense TaxID=280871 RepID=UPI0021B6325F|nr:hypothetical protein [Mycolicibacterium llatzerense]MCT7373381.1 hypothetical protein [Mycolicibacterium llatzerense]
MIGHLWCPSCGWFGRRARRRNRRAAERGLVLFHAALAREARRDRVRTAVLRAAAHPHPIPPWERRGSMCEDYEDRGCSVPWCPTGCYLTPTGHHAEVPA